MTRIALIDDEKGMVDEIKDYLEYQEHAVAVAYDAKSGLELIRNTPVDLVILDMNMPGIGGMEVLKAGQRERPGLKFLIVTGHSDDATRRAALAAGASGYLNKPFGLDDLKRAIAKTLESNR